MRLLRLLGGASNRRAAAPILTWREHSPYWVTALVSIGFLNFPFLVLPYLAPLTEIGAFAFAFKLLNLSTTILLMLSANYGPGFARCAAAGDKAGARKLLVQTQQLSMLLYVPLVAILISSFQWIHPLFGEGFGQGFSILLVLAAGQLVSAMTGLSGQLLNMSGAGANEMNIQLASLLLALSLTPISGDHFLIIGAQKSATTSSI
ncbi:MAG: O-antigen/teichoic acid export membrane protein [Candidatus Azotimanducaceae bacterium]|jgi:O-antigen/teichoic acid export membrane protein